MAEPFVERLEDSGGVLSRVRAKRKQTFVADVEGALARAVRVGDLPAAEVAEIAQRHGVDLAQDVRTPRRNLYRRFLEHCLVDHALSPEESGDLSHLRTILSLDPEDVRAVNDEAARVVYGQALDQVLADYRLDPEEEQFLQRLRAEVGLAEDVASDLHQQGAQRARTRFLGDTAIHASSLVADRRVRLELAGRSEASLEDAVHDAMDEACRAVPDLAGAELTEIRVELRDGRVAAWNVKVKTELGSA